MKKIKYYVKKYGKNIKLIIDKYIDWIAYTLLAIATFIVPYTIYGWIIFFVGSMSALYFGVIKKSKALIFWNMIFAGLAIKNFIEAIL